MSTKRTFQSYVEASGVYCTDPEARPATGRRYILEAERTVTMWGEALRMIHSTVLDPSVLDPSAMASVGSTGSETGAGIDPPAVVERARRLVSERADIPARSDAYGHMSRARLLEVLIDGLEVVTERSKPPVLVSVRPTLDNLHLSGTNLCGFVDWADATIADRHLDLALASRDLLERFGPTPLTVLLDSYGLDQVDPVVLDWYSLAAELAW